MARPRKTGLTVTSELVPDRWQDHRRVVKLTGEIIRLHERVARQLVEAVIAIGGRMAEIHEALPHGQWERWVAEAVPLTSRTIANYMRLAQWAQTRPRDIERLAHLGATKLYLLAPLEPGVRRRLTGRTPVPIPGGREAKTIDVMTVGELRKVVAGPDAFTSGGRRVPIGKLIDSIEYEIAGLDARMDLLIGRADEVEPETVVELRDRLVTMVEELEEGFGI